MERIKKRVNLKKKVEVSIIKDGKFVSKGDKIKISPLLIKTYKNKGLISDAEAKKFADAANPKEKED